jgi:dsRNA-specific ribonuclease
MATETHVRTVEEMIGYRFREKRYLACALTAAGAEEENYDGNRKLANLGTALIQFISVYIGFEANATRSKHSLIATCST